LKFIDKKTKVDSNYYVNKILKPFIEKDVPRLYPDHQRSNMIFHQDSAASHTSKKTLDFLDRSGIKYVKPTEWMPKSPDAAPMDFFIWGILKRRLQKRKKKNITWVEISSSK